MLNVLEKADVQMKRQAHDGIYELEMLFEG